jgi:DNA transposition AAA+ family ATPase
VPLYFKNHKKRGSKMVQINEASFADGVKGFLEARSWSITAMAKAAGISAAALSQFLADKYRGDNTKLRASLEGVMAREKDKSASPADVKEFVETSVSRRVFSVARSCHVYGEIGVCYSAAGLGKTESTREYARQNPDVILVEANPGYTAHYLFRELRELIGGTSRSNLLDIFTECCQRLKGSGRLLIIDEAEQLPYKALEMLRCLHDKTGIGVLLTGMPKLLANLRGNKGEYAQLYSRIGIAVKLSPITDKDTAAVMAKLLPDAGEHIRKLFHKEAAGNTRRLCKMVTRSKHLAHTYKTKVTEEVVRTAAGMVKLEVMS